MIQSQGRLDPRLPLHPPAWLGSRRVSSYTSNPTGLGWEGQHGPLGCPVAMLPVVIHGPPVTSATRLEISKWLSLSNFSASEYNELLNPKETESPLLTPDQWKHSHVDYPGAAQASASHPLQTSVCWFT